MKTPVRLWMVALAIPLLLTGMNAAADTAKDTGFMQCFYECKLFPPEAPSFYQEQTTLMLMNGDQPDAGAPQGTITRLANLAFLDGNERILGRAHVRLSPRDLDEVNVCFTIAFNSVPPAPPPPAGLVLVAIQAVTPAGELVPGKDVDVAVKNPVGRMSLEDPEVFNGRIAGVGKAPCFNIEQDISRLLADPEYENAPTWEPILIERTADGPAACGGIAGIPCDAGEVCELPPGECGNPDLLGQCISRPDICPAVWDPVCGCDKVTYANDCVRIQAGVQKDSDGVCPN